MRALSLSSTAATATFLPQDAPDPLLTRGLPASNGQGPTGSGPTVPAELTRYLAEDHDRIAQGINDVVVHRIFAAGLDLQAALALIGEHRGASKIWHAIDELDQAVRDIRNTVFDATGGCKDQASRSAQG